MIEGYLLTKLLDETYNIIKDQLAKSGCHFRSNASELQNSINNHLKKVSNWSYVVTFRDMLHPKGINDIYIELNLDPVINRLKLRKNSFSIRLKNVISDEKDNLIILGQPGAGKTTSMKFVCQAMLEGDEIFPQFNFPILIRLRELAEGYKQIPIFSKLSDELGLNIEGFEENEKKRNAIIRTQVLELLNKLNVLLILDGFDELPDNETRKLIYNDILELALSLESSKFILTSRTPDFEYSIENCKSFEILPFDTKQIEAFSEKWISNKWKAKEFVKQIVSSPFYDTTIRPLSLAHLCAIFERDGEIPEKPKTVYKKIINLLLDEWNKQRKILKKSKYANFEIDRKFDFLSKLAFTLCKASPGATTFTIEALKSGYGKIADEFQLPRKDVISVINELESHNGLFLQSEYSCYEFAHKSLQEYLIADYLVRGAYVFMDSNMLLEFPNELAIAVALSSDSTGFFTRIVLDVLKGEEENFTFYKTFLNRIVLEKPDFRHDALLAATILYLHNFTLVLEDRSFYCHEPSMAEQIIKFINNNYYFLSLKGIELVYDITKEKDMYGKMIVCLTKKKGFGMTNDPFNYPEKLYARKHFLSTKYFKQWLNGK